MTELLSIDRMRKGYSRGEEWVPVFVDVSLEVLQGEIVAVLGGRLHGKTTLLKIAAGLEHPDSGTVSLGGRALADVANGPSEIRWIDREGPAPDVEASEFVGWPLAPRGRGRREAEQTATRMLERVGAGECTGLRWDELSNWQRVLVGLARAFVDHPKLVVVDDLLDALGEPASERASDLLRSLVEESQPCPGVLISVSDLESAMFADRVFSITSQHTLKPLSGRLSDDGHVVSLPGQAQADRP